MKLIPREPTPEMVEAAMRIVESQDFRAIWRAMHSTAPTVEAEPVAFVDAGELRNIGVGGFEPTISKSPVSKWDVPLYTHPAAPQPAALPEPDYKAGEKGMLGEDCYSAATVRAYGEACARAALPGAFGRGD